MLEASNRLLGKFLEVSLGRIYTVTHANLIYNIASAQFCRWNDGQNGETGWWMNKGHIQER